MRPIKVFNAHLNAYRPLVRAIKSKDLLVTEADHALPDVYDVAIQDKNLTIRGFHACIGYLDEKYPHPPFYPIEPDKRAVIRMMIDDLLTGEADFSAYETFMPEHFFAGPVPSLLDFFIYELAPQTELWNNYRTRIDNFRR